jgi:hypothetical protein
MTVFATPQTVVLRTEDYSLDIGADGSFTPVLVLSIPNPSYPGFPTLVYESSYWQWGGFSGYFDNVYEGLVPDGGIGCSYGSSISSLIPAGAGSISITQRISTVRTITVGEEGMNVADSQVVESITVNGATVSMPPGTPAQPLALQNNGWIVSSQSSNIATITPADTFMAPVTGSGSPTPAPVAKLSSSKLRVTINGGEGSFDPQTNIARVMANSGAVTTIPMAYRTVQTIYGPQYESGVYVGLGYGPYAGDQTTNGQYFGGLDSTFGLVLDQPNVPLGTLTCKSVPNTAVCPNVPPLKISSLVGGAQYSNVSANLANWGGYRYLKLTARVFGFSDADPLPRMLIGIVPVSKLDQSLCAGALLGSPTYGVWYEIDVSSAGTTGVPATIDLAMPIASSGNWCLNTGSTWVIPNPLGQGVFRINPLSFMPGDTVNYGPDASDVLDDAVLVACCDSSECVLASYGTPATVDLSNFSFAEIDGSILSLSCYANDNTPLAAYGAGVPQGVDVSSQTDGNLLTVRRDGKTAVAMRMAYNDVAGVSYPLSGLLDEFTWADMLAGLSALGNGYTWTFNPLYTNFMAGTEWPQAFFPVPSKFGSSSTFKQGSSVTIPIEARCTSYSNSCPWADVGAISGDDPVKQDVFYAGILALSDAIGPITFPIAVQSAVITTPAPLYELYGQAQPTGYTLTTDIGPTTVTPDARGYFEVSGAAQTISEETQTIDYNDPGVGAEVATPLLNIVSPEIDGLVISFDEGLATGQSSPSGTLLQVFVPVRNGQTPPALLFGTTTSVSGVTGITYDFGFTGTNAPSLSRTTVAAFCLRAKRGGDTTYSEPRNAFWRVTSDRLNRLKASLLCGFFPFSTSNITYPKRSGAFVLCTIPEVRVYGSEIGLIYRRLDNVWVSTTSYDQLSTLSEETVIFNQQNGNVSSEYDYSTGCRLYCASLRNDGLSWQTTPTAVPNPFALPQVAVLRRRDSAGNSLPFVKTASAAISGTVWENVVYLNEPSYGWISLQVLPQGTIEMACGNALYGSTDNGSNWYDQTGTLVQSLTNQTSGELQSGAVGGTQNP